MKQKRDGGNFLHGALVLTGGMVLVKLIGAMFKIPLNYTIGEYGMGLFNMAYHFYGPVFSLATAGFPVAVSRMVSENRSLGRWNDVKAVKRAAFPLFLCFGGAGMFLLTLLAPVYCRAVSGQQGVWFFSLPPMLALAPAILFACVGAVYRGYYEGLRNMAPTACSEVIEALIKLLLGLGLSRWLVERCTQEYARFGTVFSFPMPNADEAALLTLSLAAAGAVLGVTAGSLGALLFLWLRHRLLGDGITAGQYAAAPPARGKRITRGRLIRIAIPIALGSVAANVAGLIDATFLQNRIAAVLQTSAERLLSQYPGMIPDMYLQNPETLPTFLYGCYTLAMTVYLLVPALTQPIGISALPAVTEAFSKGEKAELARRCASVCRVTALFCFPAGLGISALSASIVRLLYGAEASTPIVSGVLSILGLASLAAALCTPLSSMLQAVGRADLPVKLLLGGMTIKLLVNWLLCGVPEINLYGAALGTLLCYLFLAAAQFFCLKRECGGALCGKNLFLKPLLCGLVCGAGARAAFLALARLLPSGKGMETLSLAAAILFGGLLYVVSLFLTASVEKNDLKMLPHGQKITKTLEKWEWI